MKESSTPKPLKRSKLGWSNVENATWYIPKFEDGQVLKERDLYDLAISTFQALRVASIASKSFGFFRPSNRTLKKWNYFEIRDGELLIENLYLLSDYGTPFQTESMKIPLGNAKTIHLELITPRSSAEYGTKGCHIVPRLDLPGDDASTVMIARFDESRGPRPFFPPAAIALDATSDLLSQSERLLSTLATFRDQLIEHGVLSAVDRDALVDQLDRVIWSGPQTKVMDIQVEWNILLRRAESFFDRLLYASQSGHTRYQDCTNLKGRTLEEALKKLHLSPPATRSSIPDLKPTTYSSLLRCVEQLDRIFHADAHWYRELLPKSHEVRPRKGYPAPSARDQKKWCYDLGSGDDRNGSPDRIVLRSNSVERALRQE